MQIDDHYIPNDITIKENYLNVIQLIRDARSLAVNMRGLLFLLHHMTRLHNGSEHTEVNAYNRSLSMTIVLVIMMPV